MKKRIISRVRIFGKSLFLTMMLLLAASCQKDESADIDADGGQPSTEVSPRQLQNRAREIVNSEEYNALMEQNKSFIGKIHSEKFYTEDLFDVENETYHYDVINERLSMTSFESAEEFVQEVEKSYYLAKALVKKFPELKEASQGLQEKVEKENLKRIYSLDSKYLKNDKEQKCKREKRVCGNGVMNQWVFDMFICLRWLFSPPAYAWCSLGATGVSYIQNNDCDKMYKLCMEE